MAELEFVGGVAKPNFHMQVKFLLFFVVGGEEVPLYQMRQNGLVVKPLEREALFTTSHNVVKIFTGQQGFNLPHRFFSFYFCVLQKGFPEVMVRPFPGAAEMTNFYFKARGRFLSKKDATALLAEGGDSRKFLERQVLLPTDTLRKMVTVDRSVIREGVRHVRIGSTK